MAKKIKRRIRRKRGSGPSNMYFNKDTQAAIVEYQASTSHGDKEKLYVDKIMPTFTKLAENLIFIYGFAKPGEKYEDLRSDCVSFRKGIGRTIRESTLIWNFQYTIFFEHFPNL